MSTKIKTVHVYIAKGFDSTVYRLEVFDPKHTNKNTYQLILNNLPANQEIEHGRMILTKMFSDLKPTDTVFDFICECKEDENLINKVFAENDERSARLWRHFSGLTRDFEDWIYLYVLVKTNTILVRTVDPKNAE